MSAVTRLQVLKGTTAQRIAFLPLIGELIFDTDLSMMFVGDGVTYGGVPFTGPDSVNIAIFTANMAVTGYDYAIANSATPITFTLPSAVTYNKAIRIKNSGAGVLTVQPILSQLIDGLTDVQLNKTNAIVLVPKSGAWYIW